jgi:hypothetical protein
MNSKKDEIFNPATPGTLEASTFYSLDVCGWTSVNITPYYCAYPENKYIALRMGGFNQDESTATTTGLPWSTRSNISYRPWNFKSKYGRSTWGSLNNPAYNFPANTTI